MSVTKALYEALRFFATWLQQPTVIEVAHSVEARGDQGVDYFKTASPTK